MKIRIIFVYTLLTISFATFNTYSMVGQKRKEPEKEEQITAQPTQQPLILKRRKASPSPVKTLREISKQKFVEAVPELDNLPELLESIPADELREEIKKDFRTKLPFEENRLHRAQSEQEVEKLLYLGVNPNKKNRNRQTPINSLIERRNLNAAFHLATIADLALDYLINLQDHDTTYSQEITTSEEYSELMNYLYKKINQDIVSQPQNSQKQKNLINIANFLKTTKYRPLKIESADIYGIIPLQRAIKIGNEKLATIIIKFMQKKLFFENRSKESFKDIELSNSLNIQTKELTPLSLAVGNTPQLVDTLIQLGANVNQTNENGITPLMEAVRYNPPLVPRLVELGAQVDSADKKGNTALSYAIRYTPQLVETLIEFGANVNQANEKGRTPLLQAVFYNPSLIPELVTLGANVDSVDQEGNTALWHAVGSNKHQAIKKLLAANAAIEHQNNRGETALFAAAIEDKTTKTLKILIEARADVNHEAPDGDTALINAVGFNKPEAVEVLVKAGAEINGSGNRSPLIAAIDNEFENDDSLEIIKKLLELGANQNIKHYQTGETALEIAIQTNQLEVVRALLDAQAEITDQAIKLAEGNQDILDLLNKKLAIALG